MTQTWIVPVDALALARFGGLLSAAESERAARFHRRADRERFAVGRGALRSLLGRALGLDPRVVALAHDAHGRPRLATAEALDFNVSHAGRLVVIAVSPTGRVGIDVELIRPLHDHARVAALVCAPSEHAWLAALSASARRAAFFELWTAKEACLKATGYGLTRAPSEVAVEVGSAARLVARGRAEFGGEHYALRWLPCPPGYRLALATRFGG